MKKYQKRIGALCVAMILMLTGCQIQPDRGTETGSSSLKEEKKTEGTKSETTTEQVDIAQEPAEMIRLRIERQYYEGPDVTEGGTVFFGEYDTLALVDTDPTTAIGKALEDWNADYENEYRMQAAQYADQAKEDMDTVADGMYYYLSSEIKTERVDSQVVSLRLDNSAYRGGVHGDYWENGITFDAQNGKQLALSDLGNIQSDLKEYVWQKLKPREEDFFEDGEQTLSEMIRTEDICWYLTGQGVQIVINPYEMASFAAGQFRVLVPYQELSGINERYVPQEDTKGIEYSSLIMGDDAYEQDMDGDGVQDTLFIRTDYEKQDEMDVVTICYNTSELTLTETLGVASAYICKENGTYYLLLTTYGFAEEKTTRLYEFLDGEPVEVFRLEGGEVLGCSQDGVWTERVFQRLGTYWGHQYYILQDGILQPASYICVLANGKDAEYRHGITPKQDVPARMEQGMDGSLEDSTLRAGITIYPITIQDHPESGTSTIGFELIDGTYGELEVYIDEEGRQYVNGIEQMDLFDDLPYAG